jgi:hypothetical protein
MMSVAGHSRTPQRGVVDGFLVADATQIILPSLRSGRALWTDDTTSHIPVPLTPVSASAETPTTITTRDQKFIQEGDSDEDVASNDESIDETTNTKVSGRQADQGCEGEEFVCRGIRGVRRRAER